MTETERRNVVPVVIGLALTSLFLLLLAYLANARRNAERFAVPAITILAPTDGAAVDSPLVVRFSSSQPIELRASGWGYRTFHLHALVNGIQHMPAATDLVAEDSAHYRWTLQAVSRGAAELYIAWADQAHRPLAKGGSDTLQVTIR